MSLLDVPIGDKAPLIFNSVIEIPKGSTNKYELDKSTGLIKLDRVLHSPIFYPFDYGFIPQTQGRDGDHLDVLVMLAHPTFPGCIVEARAIGVLLMRDEKGEDEKVLAVATRDPRFNNRKSIKDLNEHTLKEVNHFFTVYKALEEKAVKVLGWKDVNTAVEVIERYRTDSKREIGS